MNAVSSKTTLINSRALRITDTHLIHIKQDDVDAWFNTRSINGAVSNTIIGSGIFNFTRQNDHILTLKPLLALRQPCFNAAKALSLQGAAT
ncbi:hypothetical protein [Cellvibrio polysaccharolyticus]|uniref:Uncharacterized protein n=1 Tax=Cellvibrio polysaccharolyticus TaxID=2082724 RepID=A0A928V664_9GAMM|nr:hypothetical protein [Cellvibrio polysaccharolyticus]MBE8716809.1 hypothetical protein [Cellvibrio polysaccharolyticus]